MPTGFEGEQLTFDWENRSTHYSHILKNNLCKLSDGGE